MKKTKERRFNCCKIYGITTLVCVWSLLALLPLATAQSLFDEDSFGNELYQDITARKVGDTVTVVILQDARADQSTETNRERQAALDASYGLSGDIAGPSAGAKVGGQTSRSGTQSISRQVNFIATVTAQVVEVLPNGQLKIEGKQYTSIGDQKTEISVSGIINKTDIASDNTVPSSAIANARVEYREPAPKEHKVVTVLAFPFRLFGKILKWIF